MSSSADATLTESGTAPPDEDFSETRVGRYVLLERIGAGGMGVVSAAYDPDLERKVAIKVSFARHDATRAASEAHALARFTHPNVVTVYDAGTHRDRVWIAMELIEGRTLRAWAAERRRSWRQVLEVVIAAGRGLAAVHAAGFVHGDIKPDNVMIVDDPRAPRTVGRVLLMDFGMAAPLSHGPTMPSAQPRSGLHGTPGYMAPEQHEHGQLDARTDQFAFCVTAWELLYREHPFGDDPYARIAAISRGRVRRPSNPNGPRWLRRVLQRGLAAEAGARHPGMTALLDALQRGRLGSRRRAATGIVASGAIAIATAFAARSATRALDEAACRRTSAAIDDIWPGEDASVAAAVRAGLLATGKPYAEHTYERAVGVLDSWSANWREHAMQVCSDPSITSNAESRTLAEACLADKLDDAEVLLDTLANADEDVLYRAPVAVSGLPDPSSCTDVSQLRAAIQPPEGLDRNAVAEVRRVVERVHVMHIAGRVGDAIAPAEDALAQAQRIGWPILVAQARFELAEVEQAAGHDDVVAEQLEECHYESFRAGDDVTAVRCAAMLASTIGDRFARHDEGIAWIRHAQAAYERLGTDHEELQAQIWSHEGTIQHSRAHYQEALRLRERALALYESVIAADDLRIVHAVGNVAVTAEALGDYSRAEREYLHAEQLLRGTYGDEHPEIGRIYINLANAQFYNGRLPEAVRTAERARDMLFRTVGPEHRASVLVVMNLSGMRWSTGEYAAARSDLLGIFEVAERTLGSDHPQYATMLMNLAEYQLAWLEFDEAIRLLVRALEIRERVYGPDNAFVARGYSALARAELRGGRLDAAAEHAERARELCERVGDDGLVILPGVLGVLGSVRIARGELDEAARVYVRARDASVAAFGYELSEMLNEKSALELARGRPRSAVELAEASARDARSAQEGAIVEAQAHLALARALAREGRDPARTTAQIAEAKRRLRAVGTPRAIALLGELERETSGTGTGTGTAL